MKKAKNSCLMIAIILVSTFNLKAQIASALNFDGVNNYVSLQSLAYNTNGLTLEAWIKPQNITTTAFSEIVRQETGSLNFLFSFQNNGTILSFGLANTITYQELDVTITPSYFTDGNWHHVAAVFNGVNQIIYIDGNQAGILPFTSIAQSTNLGLLAIGSNAQGTSEFFKGSIDEVRIWNRAICQSELQNNMNAEIATTAIGLVANYHFNQGTANATNTITTLVDATGNGNNGTLTNFALTGLVSNWVNPGAVISGSIAPIFAAPNIVITGTNTICYQTSSILTASGGSSYLWNTGATTATINAVPNGNTTYSVIGTNSLGCTAYAQKSITIAYCNNETVIDFNYTGSVQSFTVPNCVSQVTITCFGASGAMGVNGTSGNAGGSAGLGSIVKGVYSVTAANSVLNLFVGGTATANVGGFNGGGSNGVGNGAGGGGASDVRLNGSLASDRIIVAGGGGGGGNGGCVAINVKGGNGGNGGANGTNGIASSSGGGGFGGVGITGGLKGIGCPSFSGLDATNGNTLGIGGNGGNGQTCCCTAIVGGGAGGGGYFGGGGGGGGSAGTSGCFGNEKGAGGGGAGGSNYFDPAFTATTVLNATNLGDGLINIAYIVNTPTITVASGTICAGQSFTIAPSGATSYTIQGGSATVTPTANSTYTVIGSNVIPGCLSNVVTSSVIVNTLPTVSVNSGTICSGNSFTITPSGASTYTVQGGATTVSPLSNTTYTIIGTNTLGCVSANTATSSVIVNTTPTVSVNSGTICSGNSFTITPNGASTYTVQGGVTTVSPLSNTTYTVIGTNTLGCVSANTATSSIIVNANPTITVNSGTICSGNSFTIVPSGATTYTISGGSTVVSPTVTSNYTVMGTGVNGCESSTVVTVLVSTCVGVNELLTNEKIIHIYPNPNGGEFNIELNTDAKVIITNALGQEFFNSTLNFGNHNINISNIANGIYMVKVMTLSHQQTVKLIKQ